MRDVLIDRVLFMLLSFGLACVIVSCFFLGVSDTECEILKHDLTMCKQVHWHSHQCYETFIKSQDLQCK